LDHFLQGRPENRTLSASRRLIIAAHPTLQERAQTKTRDVMAALTMALRDRGVPDRAAGLVAQMAMTAMSHAVNAWFENDTGDLGLEIEQAFRDVHDLSAGASPRASQRSRAKRAC